MYKYAGEFVWKESPLGLEQFPVGSNRETGTQGGFGSRERRRARRTMFSIPGFAAPPAFPGPFQPQVYPGILMPQPPMFPPPAQGPPPANAPAAGFAVPQSKAPGPVYEVEEGKRGGEWKEEKGWSKKPKNEKSDDWAAKDEGWARPKAWGGQSWGKAKANDKWKASQPNLKVEYRGYSQAVHGQWMQAERTIRLANALQLFGPTWKLQWCLDCRLKNYAGGDLCTTPGCRIPDQLRHVLPEKPQETVQHVKTVVFDEACKNGHNNVIKVANLVICMCGHVLVFIN